MSTSANKRPRGKRVWFARQGNRSWLMVELVDGRSVGVPLALYPTLSRANPRARTRYRSIGDGDGFSWPALDLDLSVEGIVAGREEQLKPRRRSA